MTEKTILVIGTYDTKDDELGFLADVIRGQGGRVLTMDVSVLGDPSKPCDYSKHDVAQEAGSSIAAAIASGDENRAMQVMAAGAALLAARLNSEGAFDGTIVLGGTMGTDLALDVCSALPLGVPKYIVSTVSFFAVDPGRAVGGRYTDDPLGGWAIWSQLGLQSLAEPSRRCGAGRGAGGAKARPGQANDWYDLAWHIGAQICDPAQARAGRTRI